MPPRPRRILVAGTAGGVGTTTVAALLLGRFARTGHAPVAVDRTAGELLRRGASRPQAEDRRFRLHDLGRNADAALGELKAPGGLGVLVTADTEVGVELALAAVHRNGSRRGAPAGTADRVVIVLAEVFGPSRLRQPVISTLRGAPGVRGVVRFRHDDALAAGESINTARLSRGTTNAVGELAAQLGAGRQGWSMAPRAKRQPSPPMDWSQEN